QPSRGHRGDPRHRQARPPGRPAARGPRRAAHPGAAGRADRDVQLSMALLLQRCLPRAFDVEDDEAGALVDGFVMFFLLFAGYFMLRPVRETMGIAGGVRNLQWLFTGTFVATLAAMPLFGWIAGRVRRRDILYWVYGFFVLNLAAFAACFAAMPGDPWIARAFY